MRLEKIFFRCPQSSALTPLLHHAADGMVDSLFISGAFAVDEGITCFHEPYPPQGNAVHQKEHDGRARNLPAERVAFGKIPQQDSNEVYDGHEHEGAFCHWCLQKELFMRPRGKDIRVDAGQAGLLIDHIRLDVLQI